MTEELDHIRHLQQRLADLQEKQELFQTQILQLKKEIEQLRKMQEIPVLRKEDITQEKTGIKIPEREMKFEEKVPPRQTSETVKKESAPVEVPKISEVDNKSDLERFIGENLINKIGIVITIIGVAIGVKYAIDHQLVSPVARIILGYIVGLVLLFFAIRLKKQYEKLPSHFSYPCML